MYDFVNDSRFNGITPLEERAWLALATLHKEDEMRFIERVYKESYITTEASNVNEMEATISRAHWYRILLRKCYKTNHVNYGIAR